VYDELNGTKRVLTPREIEIIRRIQSGAAPHPEHEANPDHVSYFSSIPEMSGLNADRSEPKRRFQPSVRDKRLVGKMLQALKDGKIDMDFLEGKKKTMQPKSAETTNDPFLMWRGDEEDELAARKGPAHIAAPKMDPPTHAESYRPPAEYIPTEKELKEWEELDPEDRPYGHLVPKEFPNLRSVGAYENAVRDRFERCLDLYVRAKRARRSATKRPSAAERGAAGGAGEGRLRENRASEGIVGGRPPEPPPLPARSLMCSAAHVLGRACSRPRMFSTAHVLGRACARPIRTPPN
jgi:ribosome biogenesis protein ERB1